VANDLSGRGKRRCGLGIYLRLSTRSVRVLDHWAHAFLRFASSWLCIIFSWKSLDQILAVGYVVTSCWWGCEGSTTNLLILPWSWARSYNERTLNKPMKSLN
jgi:hypothetical protein